MKSEEYNQSKMASVNTVLVDTRTLVSVGSFSYRRQNGRMRYPSCNEVYLRGSCTQMSLSYRNYALTFYSIYAILNYIK